MQAHMMLDDAIIALSVLIVTICMASIVCNFGSHQHRLYTLSPGQKDLRGGFLNVQFLLVV